MSKEAEHQPTSTRSKGDERRESLIRVAYHVIATKGFEGLRVRDIAEQVGVNIATLHYYFNTKDDLVRGVVDHVLQQFLSVTAPSQHGEDEQNPESEIRYVFRDLQYQLNQMPELFAVLTELYLHSRRNPAIHESLNAMNRGWKAHLEQVITQGIASGVFRSDLDVLQSASLVTALVTGISLQSISHLNTFDLEQITEIVLQSFKPSHG